MNKFENSQNHNVYFKISYDQKDEAKKNGYFWDPEKKCWYKKLYVNKNNNFKLVYDLCKVNNSEEVYKIFDDIKLSQEITKDKLYSS